MATPPRSEYELATISKLTEGATDPLTIMEKARALYRQAELLNSEAYLLMAHAGVLYEEESHAHNVAIQRGYHLSSGPFGITLTRCPGARVYPDQPDGWAGDSFRGAITWLEEHA